jgi:hypothetical protein
MLRGIMAGSLERLTLATIEKSSHQGPPKRVVSLPVTPANHVSADNFSGLFIMDRILTERRGHILVVTINRPEARNAFDSVSAQAMYAAMDLLDSEDG